MTNPDAIDFPKLTADLRAARTAALAAITNLEDGGTCNLDDAILALPGDVPERQVTEACRQAGLRCYRRDDGRYHLFAPVGAQGYVRTAQAEAMAGTLAERGWTCTVYYQMD